MKTITILFVPICLLSGTLQAVATPPNLVLIVIDDLGYGDLGCYGNPTIRTPNIDQLAAEGRRFSDFHANGPMCTPTRVAILTGRYQQRFGTKFEGPLSGQSDYDDGLPLEALTIAEALKRQGYATGMYGKWHLGYRPPLMPTRQGFDDFRGLVSGDGDHHSHIDRSGRRDWWHNENIEMEAGYSVDLITRHSVDFIQRHKKQPFFLYVPHLAVHFPWQRPTDVGYRREGTSYHNLSKLGKLRGTNVGEIARTMVEAVDGSVGRIVATLKELGLDRKTFVFFTSDNGGYLRYAGGYHNISSNGRLRGEKGEMYEGGHRVPALAWWPGKITAGTMTDQTAMTFDLFPTFLKLASAGDETGLDGTDLTALLLDDSDLEPRTLFWRIGNRKAVRRGDWKLVTNGDSPPELYNLARDLGEQQDLASRHPARAAELLTSLATWEADVDQLKRPDK